MDVGISTAPEALERVIDRVAAVCPHPADPLEAAAVLESLGYTDAVIRELTGQPDSRSLGRVLHTVMKAGPGAEAGPRLAPTSQGVRDELRVLLQTFSLSSIYALPWVVTFALERRHPDVLQLPLEAAAPFTLALMLSLIVSGGFVQCIARKGTFYIGLGQHALGAAVTERIWQCGAATIAATALMALGAAWYLDLFELPYAALGAGVYIMLGTFWLTCGVLWLERRYWQVPAAFGGAGAAFATCRAVHVSPLVSQILAISVALGIALGLVAFAFRRYGATPVGELASPRHAVLVRALAPYFCYGSGYFAFVFADRIAAGTSVPVAAGIEFGIDARYQAGMDAALLVFLLSMAAVEFINYRFVHFWQQEASRWTASAGVEYQARIQRRCVRARALVAVAFVAIALLVLPVGRPTLTDPIASRVMVLGLCGYLLLELGLFNALVLFSVNAPVPVLRALVAGVMVNALGGYVSSNVFGSTCAAAAMCAGAAVFLWRSHVAVAVALERPGYGCYVA